MANFTTRGRPFSDYDRAIEIDPENADAYKCIMGMAMEGGRLSDYDRAIQIKPDYAKGIL